MNNSRISRLSASLTSRRGARWWTGAFLAGIVLIFGVFSSVQAPQRSANALVNGSDSAQVAHLIAAEDSSDTTKTSALLVAGRTDGAALAENELAAISERSIRLSTDLGITAGPALPSDDAQAAMIPLSWETVSEDEDRKTLTETRDWLLEHPISDVQLQVTGSTAFAVDITQAFAGADFTLLAVTVLIVAALLIFTYRSPILWLLPLVVVALADGVSSVVAKLLGNAWNLNFDSGVLSVLVFGAGTNYALLLISRYRDELRQNEDHRQALAKAWVKSFEAICTSNVTVVLALLTLGLAVMEDTRGLGLVCAAGLFIAAIFVLFALPPVLALCGRKVFWPLIPRPGQEAKKENFFGRAAHAVMRKPRQNLAALIVLMLVLAGAMAGTRIGLDQAEQFRTPTESATAMKRLADHFPAGETQPIMVLTLGAETASLQQEFAQLPGVERVGAPSALSTGDWEKFSVIAAMDPSSDQAHELIAQLRHTAAERGTGEVLIGGQTAQHYDAQQSHLRDLWIIAPLIMVICFVMLGWLTRSWRTALILGLVNLLSAASAIGLGALVSVMVFDAQALDVQVPLLAFVFLVALGVDYTIFLTQRVRQNVQRLPLNESVVRAASQTGSVITSAGLVLAGVFAALATLPLTVLGQLGLIVGLGVLLDTFVVRTLLLPALFAVLGASRFPLFGASRKHHTPTPSEVQTLESEINA